MKYWKQFKLSENVIFLPARQKVGKFIYSLYINFIQKFVSSVLIKSLRTFVEFYGSFIKMPQFFLSCLSLPCKINLFSTNVLGKPGS